MLLVDSHTHLNELTWSNLNEMYLAGIRKIVSPIHLDAGKAVSSDVIREMWDYLFDIHMPRADKNFIKVYGLIGVSMVSTPKDDPTDLFKILPEYINRPDVVGIGEIGFEPNSRTCKDLDQQERLFQIQLQIAKNIGTTVVVHVPNPPDKKKEFTARSLKVIKESGISITKVVIDHCSDMNIKMVLDAGAHAAISVQPWRNMTPQLAAELVQKFGSERVMIDSDCGSGPSDPIAVANTAFALKTLGLAAKTIEQVCSGNSLNFYNIND
jgi:predicted metal-dependent TIM-barrel fold hydrolase